MVRSGNTGTSLNPSSILWHRRVHVPALQHWASHLYKTAGNDLVSSLPRSSAEPPYPCWRVWTPSLTTQARGLTVTQLVSSEPSCLGDTSPAQFHGCNTLGIAGDQVQKAPPSHADCFSFTPVEIKRHQSCHRCWWSGCNPRGSKQEHPKPTEGWDLSPFIYTHSLSHALNHFAYWNVSVDNHCQNTTQNPPKSTTGSGNHDLPFHNINA